MKWEKFEMIPKLNEPELYFEKDNCNFKINIFDDENKEVFIMKFSEPIDCLPQGTAIELERLNTLVDEYRNKGLAKYYMTLLTDLCISNSISVISIIIGTDKFHHYGSEKILMDKERLKKFYKSFEKDGLEIIIS
ncbi:hypothetical protein [Enterococcus sp. AZ051]|uniref:hypothetical protein n=1 Tax=Enterococcus sp. AZ051 TaxID=2774698 RepID=UPI003D2916BC